MRLPFERSPLFLQWMIGTWIIMAPLVFAVAYATWSLDNQLKRQEKWVYRVISNSQLGVSLADYVKELERSARQFVVLQTSTSEELFKKKRAKLLKHIETLNQSQPAELNRAQLVWLETFAEGVIPLVSNGYSGENRLGRINAAFNEANELASQYNSAVYLWVNQKMEQTASAYKETKQHLITLLVSVVPISAVLGWVVFHLCTRPVRALSIAIKRIGNGTWTRPVKIRGPKDFELLGERLDWLRHQLQELDKQKLLFVQHITHELKTPLAAIIDASELLMDEVPGKTTDAQKNVLDIQHSHAHNLMTQIQQLLDFNGLAEDSLLQIEICDITHLFLDIVKEHTKASHFRNVTIEYHPTHLTIPTDRSRLAMIFKNLLSNALKHSPKGGTISVHTEIRENNFLLSVVDDGPGINLAHVEKLFLPFYQEENYLRHKASVKGGGIGLSIVQKCVTDLKGSIDATNVTHRGACFTITLPIRDKTGD